MDIPKSYEESSGARSRPTTLRIGDDAVGIREIDRTARIHCDPRVFEIPAHAVFGERRGCDNRTVGGDCPEIRLTIGRRAGEIKYIASRVIIRIVLAFR